MVDPTFENSNQILDTLADWNKALEDYQVSSPEPTP